MTFEVTQEGKAFATVLADKLLIRLVDGHVPLIARFIRENFLAAMKCTWKFRKFHF